METNSSHIDTSVYNPIIWCNIPDCLVHVVCVFKFVIERYSKTVCNFSISFRCKRCDLFRFVSGCLPACFISIHLSFGYFFLFGLSWDINNSLNNIQMSIHTYFLKFQPKMDLADNVWLLLNGLCVVWFCACMFV